MTTPVLGPELEGFECNLPIEEDFCAEILIPADEPALDPDAEVRLHFYDVSPPVTWLGQLLVINQDEDGARLVVFNIDEALVAALRVLKPKKVRLQYVLGGAKLPWDAGRVRVV